MATSSTPPDSQAEPFRPFLKELSDSFDDMVDGPEIVRAFPSLPLEACQPITEAFRRTDTSALGFQTWHRWLTRSAAGFGTAAVALAIVELGYQEIGASSPFNSLLVALGGEVRLSQAELFSVLIAVVAAAWGMGWAHKERWLWQRHQAESCRVLKYRFLIQPSLWTQPEWIQQQLKKICSPDAAKATNREIKDALWQATREPVPHGPFEVSEHELPRETVRALVEYYLARRLSPQKEYLANRIVKNEKGDRIERIIFLLFIGSVAAVLLRFVPELLRGSVAESWPVLLAAGASIVWALAVRVPKEKKGTWLEWVASLVLVASVGAILALTLSRIQGPEKESAWSIRFTYLAALLPALAAGVRLLRSSGEFSRNKARFEAAHRALGELEECLTHDGFSTLSSDATKSPSGPLEVILSETETPGLGVMSFEVREHPSGDLSDSSKVNAYAVVRDLWWCEHILRSEHMEWLRLMHETEWFG